MPAINYREPVRILFNQGTSIEDAKNWLGISYHTVNKYYRRFESDKIRGSYPVPKVNKDEKIANRFEQVYFANRTIQGDFSLETDNEELIQLALKLKFIKYDKESQTFKPN